MKWGGKIDCVKILVFTEGTVLLEPNLKNLTREERVAWSKNAERPLPEDFFKNYIPNGQAVEKLRSWKNQGAEIFYLTSRKTPKQVKDIKKVLKRYDFPDHKNLLFRRESEEYRDVAKRLMPDIIVEDDCESIGGEEEMTHTHIRPELKKGIKLVSVPEFGGIDHLPDRIEELG